MIEPITIDRKRNELWFRGNLSFKLHAGQKLIKQKIDTAPGQLCVLNCSRQWGKTYLMVTRAIELAIKKPKARIKIGTAFLTDLTEFIIPTFEAILVDCPDSIKPKYKVQGSKFVFQNGSEIKLVGLDKSPNGLRGNTIDMIILDEAGFISNLDYLYKSVIVPATTHRPDCKIILISTPPATPAHDYVDFVHKAEAEGSYSMFDIHTNPMIDEATIERLSKESGGINSTTWKREYLCQFITDADSQIIPEWRDEFVIDAGRDPYTPFYHRYVGLDLGIKDFTVAIFGYYDFRRATLVIEDELKLNGPSLTTQLLKDSIEATEKRLWPDNKVYRRISDNNNPQLINDMAILHRMSFISTDKDRLETMINELRLMVNKGQIEVHPRCLQMIGCLKYGVWDKNKKAFARSSVYGHFDALAALVYLVRNLDKHCNPIPRAFGFDERNSVIKEPKNNSEGARMLNQIFHRPTKAS